jgi:hypothetical protein
MYTVSIPNIEENYYSSLVDEMCNIISNAETSTIDFLSEDNNLDIYINVFFLFNYTPDDTVIYENNAFNILIGFKNKDEPTCEID